MSLNKVSWGGQQRILDHQKVELINLDFCSKYFLKHILESISFDTET